MKDNLSLLMDLYELTMGQGYFIYKPSSSATFDLFVRDMPQNRNYLVACGLQDVIGYLKILKFSRNDINYLRRLNLFSGDFFKYLGNFRFKGDLWAIPEGTVFFPNEPILRVTAGIIEAQVVESFLLNTINLQTMIASKSSRIVSAADGRGVYDFSLRRTHGAQAGIKVARSSYIAGCRGTSNILAAKLYNLPVTGTMAHSFVMSFKSEIDSFLAYASIFPKSTILLVDTYDTRRGIENAVFIGKYLRERGYKLKGIRLDSGDILSLSKFARHAFDKAGLDYVKIFASGNLDEFKIRGLVKNDSCVDNFGVGTNMGTSSDAPSLDVIYKLSEVTDEGGRFIPTMKLSKGKITYPGRKQVYRIKGKKGNAIRDIVGLEGEKIKGEKLLVRIINKGRVVYKSPALSAIRDFAARDLSCFPAGLRDINRRYNYPVEMSWGLKKLKSTIAGSRETEDR